MAAWDTPFTASECCVEVSEGWCYFEYMWFALVSCEDGVLSVWRRDIYSEYPAKIIIIKRNDLVSFVRLREKELK